MTFYVNGKRYKLNIAWNTVTLKQAVAITQLRLDEEKLKHLLESDEVTYCDDTMRYITSVLDILTNCPNMEQVDNDSKVVMFDLIKYMIRMLYYMNIEEYQPEGISHIRFNSKRYVMPESIMIEDKPILCHKEPCKNIVEASNIMKVVSEMKSEGLSKMKYVCAIYLKEQEGEMYNPEVIAKRAKEFEELPMNVVWDVFFFMYFSLAKYMHGIVVPSLSRMGRLQRVKYSILGFLQLLKKAWLALLVRLRR
jgi:hypothetical protein